MDDTIYSTWDERKYTTNNPVVSQLCPYPTVSQKETMDNQYYIFNICDINFNHSSYPVSLNLSFGEQYRNGWQDYLD